MYSSPACGDPNSRADSKRHSKRGKSSNITCVGIHSSRHRQHCNASSLRHVTRQGVLDLNSTPCVENEVGASCVETLPIWRVSALRSAATKRTHSVQLSDTTPLLWKHFWNQQILGSVTLYTNKARAHKPIIKSWK